MWIALYPLVWIALFAGSNLYWFLPAGLRLGALWLLPRRAWWQLALAEWAGIVAVNASGDGFASIPALLISTLLPWGVYALALRSVGRHQRGTSARAALPRLLVVGVVAATLNALVLSAVDLNDDGNLAAGLAATLVSYGLGDLSGVIVVVPIMLALHDQAGPARVPWGALFARGLVVTPLLVAAALSALPVEAPVYPLVLALFPLFAVAYRYGWRAGAVAFGLLGLGLQLLDAPSATLWGAGQLQLLLGLAGCAALLLGVASETQRAQRLTLSSTVDALSLRGNQLADAANRMASLQEEERRRIGAELHDQLGQDMTAIATRLRVFERHALDPAQRAGLASIAELMADAHTHLREVINHLHPAVLDRFGLARALAEGPFAEMLREQGIHYSAMIEGEVDTLPDSVASALYRICQEAATNCAKHGCGGRVHIQLVLAPDATGAELTLHIEDSAGALKINTDKPGRGLQNIRDRAQAMGAEYGFDPTSGMPRHTLRLRVLPPPRRATARTS